MLITPGNEKYVHHSVMYECAPEYESIFLRGFKAPSPGNCFPYIPLSDWTGKPNARMFCNKISLGKYILN